MTNDNKRQKLSRANDLVSKKEVIIAVRNLMTSDYNVRSEVMAMARTVADGLIREREITLRSRVWYRRWYRAVRRFIREAA
jgi:hypothetical protein